MSKVSNDKYCLKLKLHHESSDVLYPVKIENTDTGKVAFRVSPGGNTKQHSLEIEDELSMLDYVLKQDYQVRAQSLNSATGGSKKRSGLNRLSQRSILKHEYI